VADLPSVSVVMPTYRRRGLLPRVLRPVLDDPGATEVVVVVDGCRDGSFELLEGMASTEPRLRPRFVENAGAAGARRAGVEAASGEVVLLLDDDVLAGPGLASGHAARHRTPGIALLGYVPPRLPGGFAARLLQREYEACCRLFERDPDAVLRHVWAGNLSLRRPDALTHLPHPGERRIDYHEDQELGLRCLEAGLRGVFDRSLYAEHLYDRSPEAFLRDAHNQGAGQVRLHERHGDLIGPLDLDQFGAGLPEPLQAWLRLCRRPGAGAATVGVLRAAIHASGCLGSLRVQELAARLARRVEQQRGALATQRRAG
jgi:glycosyltransferase involved in cell wall biosynthesis